MAARFEVTVEVRFTSTSAVVREYDAEDEEEAKRQAFDDDYYDEEPADWNDDDVEVISVKKLYDIEDEGETPEDIVMRKLGAPMLPGIED